MDKCNNSSTGSTAPICTEYANSPHNSILTELVLPPADDSFHNMKQMMDTEMFNQLLLSFVFVIYVCVQQEDC